MDARDLSTTRRLLLGALGAGALAGCTAVYERIPGVGDEHGDVEPHYHGYLFVEIDSEAVDFSAPKYLLEESDRAVYDFHFHEDDEANRWHMEGQHLTLAEGLDYLPEVEYAVEEGASVLTIEGRTYRDGGNATIAITERESGEIEPADYDLQDGDVIEITIETA